MKSVKVALFLGWIVSTIPAANGQIVNIENQRLSSKKEGWTGSVDLWFNLVKNTQMIFQMGNRNRVLWTEYRKSLMFLTDLSMVKAGTQDLVNSGFEHIRYGLRNKHYGFLYWETFEQAQYNRVQLIDLRILTGTGFRAIVLDKDSASLSLGAFVMGEYEQQRDDITQQTVRYSSFLSFDFQFTKSFGLNAITYYQPDFLNPADYRLSAEASIRLKINTHLSFNLVYNLFYDSRPVESIPSTTYGLRNALRYVF